MITQQDLDDHRSDYLGEIRLAAREQTLLDRHPDCRDPEHPGCILCLDIQGRPLPRRVLTLKGSK